MKVKKKFFKGDVIIIWKDGEETNQSTNMDADRELSVGDVFEWQVNGKMQPMKMKVLNINFPIAVEEVE